MKKNLILVFFIFLFAAGCKSINVNVKNYPILIAGKWQAEHFGNTVIQLGLSLPSFYEFNENGKFTSTLTIEGKPKQFSGKFIINASENPAVITIERSDERIFHGIIRFENKNKFTMILYDKRILPLTRDFSTDDVQVYNRID